MDWSAFVGLPWQDRGRDAGGYDCWGIVVAAFRAGTCIELPSHADGYSSAADKQETAAIFAGEVGDWIEQASGKEAEFDAAVMLIGRRFHVGLIVRRGLMLHMPFRSTSVIAPLSRFPSPRIFRHTRLM